MTTHMIGHMEDENINTLILNSFIEFWDKFHNITGKRKENREPAFKHWKKLTEKERAQALENISLYFKSLSDPKYCKMARTYLADKNFNDEFDKPVMAIRGQR